jgi:hypothetical protein
MANIKGSEKTGGRKKGSINKKTAMWNEVGEWLLSEGLSQYMEDLKTLEIDKRMTRTENLLEYFKPKMSRQEVKHGLDDKVTEVEITIKK